jgi:2-oxoisovalerate dehydrogenase E1 component beta subunit
VLLRAAIRDPNPVLFFEHKSLYRKLKADRRLLESWKPEDLLVGRARSLRQGNHVTIFSYGATVHAALVAAEAVDKDGISTEVVDLRALAPLDEEMLLCAAKKTGKALIVHEACLTSGFGAELAARICEKVFEFLDAPIRRIAYPDHPVPYAKALESACLPSAERIVEAIRELHKW